MRNQSLADSLRLALAALSPEADLAPDGRTELAEIERTLNERGIEPGALLAEAALAASKPEAVEGGGRREQLSFVTSDNRPPEELLFGERRELLLSSKAVLEAVVAANTAIKVVSDVSEAYEVTLFEILGLRNLSAFVGEVLKDQLAKVLSDLVLPNPNQDGHPDLLALTPDARTFLDELATQDAMTAKEHFSPFRFGGLEVKATCGDTPPARLVPKPKIGESRLPIMKGLNWKAHHRQTNDLLAIVWDFVDGIATVLATFFRNDLSEDDWGKMITPKGTSRTTSVSIMGRGGVRKMAMGWVVLPDDEDLRGRLLQVMGFGADRPGSFPS
jgi:hypothetical protein